ALKLTDGGGAFGEGGHETLREFGSDVCLVAINPCPGKPELAERGVKLGAPLGKQRLVRLVTEAEALQRGEARRAGGAETGRDARSPIGDGVADLNAAGL